MKKIRVKHSGVVNLNYFDDFPDGNLVIAEAEMNIPFKIKRVYVINHLFNKISTRGKHAHKKHEQYIFCINGSFVLHLDDGKNKQRILMNKPQVGVRLGSKLWHTMTGFTSDCVILVISDQYYDESDYIRDYDEFLKYIKNNK